MSSIPSRLPESSNAQGNDSEYKIDKEARALRLALQKTESLPHRNEVATYAGRLVVGVKKDGLIFEKATGKLVGNDPHPNEDN